MFKFLINLFTGKGLHIRVSGDRLMLVYQGEITDKKRDAIERVLEGTAHARAYPQPKPKPVEQPSFTVADGSIYQTGSGRRPELYLCDKVHQEYWDTICHIPETKIEVEEDK